MSADNKYPTQEELEAMRFEAACVSSEKELSAEEWGKVFYSNFARLIIDWHNAQLAKQEPVAHAVLEGRDFDHSGWGHIAAWPEACHEHINDAINEHDIQGAGDWRVIPLYATQMPAQAPEGWKPVPIDPTHEMLKAACLNYESCDYTGHASIYRAMLAAAPTPPNAEQCLAALALVEGK